MAIMGNVLKNFEIPMHYLCIRSQSLCIYIASTNINRTLIKLEKWVFSVLKLFLLVCKYVTFQKEEQLLNSSMYK